nr:reverse transcriptase domain-containing protein [Tanacetum cinerariifolium]
MKRSTSTPKSCLPANSRHQLLCHFLISLQNLYPMDDEPTWAVDCVVAPTPGSVIIIPKTANEFTIKETPRMKLSADDVPLSLNGEAKTWLDELNEGTIETKCSETLSWSQPIQRQHHKNHSLNEINQEVLNATAGGIFLYRTPNQAYQLLEDKVLLKLDWAKNQKTKSSLKKTVAFVTEGSSNSDTNKIMARIDAKTMKMDAQYKDFQSHSKQSNLDDDDIPIACEEEANFMQTFHHTHFYNDYRDRDSNCHNWRSSRRNDYNRDNYQSHSDDKPDL